MQRILSNQKITYVTTVLPVHNEHCNTCSEKAVYVILGKVKETKVALPYCKKHFPPQVPLPKL